MSLQHIFCNNNNKKGFAPHTGARAICGEQTLSYKSSPKSQPLLRNNNNNNKSNNVLFLGPFFFPISADEFKKNETACCPQIESFL